ncbi:MAG: divalent-cation tolerance protein CutA [Cyanobacteria bacterium LVE1205-1]
MRLYYVTLNSVDEARTIGKALLEHQLAVCVNWFPITCLYRWEGTITEEPEVVLIIKTHAGLYEAIVHLMEQHITYTHFIGQFSPESVNSAFLHWLNQEIPHPPIGKGGN